MKKRALFIDRDGTLVVEPPVDYQIDTLEKLEFLPKVISSLSFLRKKMNYELVMVSNQDGLGTESFPEETFWPSQNMILKTLAGEDIEFDDILIDRSMPEENSPNRKPGVGMLGKYLSGDYDLSDCFVIGDRITDVELAKNLGSRAILFSDNLDTLPDNLKEYCVLVTTDWWKIAEFIFAGSRKASMQRTTKETDIQIDINLDGNGDCQINTGIGFFDHMLEQIGRHGGIDMKIKVRGDLKVDGHHTIEDTGIVLGHCIKEALGDKRGVERYGFVLPMDDSRCQVLIDFGGRSWLVWDAKFKREKIGDFPTEMLYHFFKSFSDAANINLSIHAVGDNEHHKSEAIFKALGRALKMAIKRDIWHYNLPSTKGLL